MKKMILGLILLTGLLSCNKEVMSEKQKHLGQCGIIINDHDFSGGYKIIDVQFQDGYVGSFRVSEWSHFLWQDFCD